MPAHILRLLVLFLKLRILQKADYFEQFACQIHQENKLYRLYHSTLGFHQTLKPYSFCGGLVKWASFLHQNEEVDCSEIRLPFPDNPKKPDGKSAGVADVLASRPTCSSLTLNAGPYYRWLDIRKIDFNNHSRPTMKNQQSLDKFLCYSEVQEVIIPSANILHFNDADCHDDNLALVRFCHSTAHTHCYTRAFLWQDLWCLPRSILSGRETDLMPGGV